MAFHLHRIGLLMVTSYLVANSFVQFVQHEVSYGNTIMASESSVDTLLWSFWEIEKVNHERQLTLSEKIISWSAIVDYMSWDKTFSHTFRPNGSRNQFNRLAQIRIPRWFGGTVDQLNDVHVYCDASVPAYAAIEITVADIRQALSYMGKIGTLNEFCWWNQSMSKQWTSPKLLCHPIVESISGHIGGFRVGY